MTISSTAIKEYIKEKQQEYNNNKVSPCTPNAASVLNNNNNNNSATTTVTGGFRHHDSNHVSRMSKSIAILTKHAHVQNRKTKEYNVNCEEDDNEKLSSNTCANTNTDGDYEDNSRKSWRRTNLGISRKKRRRSSRGEGEEESVNKKSQPFLLPLLLLLLRLLPLLLRRRRRKFFLLQQQLLLIAFLLLTQLHQFAYHTTINNGSANTSRDNSSSTGTNNRSNNTWFVGFSGIGCALAAGTTTISNGGIISSMTDTKFLNAEAVGSEIDDGRREYLDKLGNLERSVAAILIKVAYGTSSTTKRSIPDNIVMPPYVAAASLTTIATPLLTTQRYMDKSLHQQQINLHHRNYELDLERDHALPTSAPNADILKSNSNPTYPNPNRHHNHHRNGGGAGTVGSGSSSSVSSFSGGGGPTFDNWNRHFYNSTPMPSFPNLFRKLNVGGQSSTSTISMYTSVGFGAGAVVHNNGDLPSYPSSARAFFTPPLPPDYQNPFADKPTLRGTNNEGAVGGSQGGVAGHSNSGIITSTNTVTGVGTSFINRRPIPPPSLMPGHERIPYRPPDLAQSVAVAITTTSVGVDGWGNKSNYTSNSTTDNDHKKPLNTPARIAGASLSVTTSVNNEYKNHYEEMPSTHHAVDSSGGSETAAKKVLPSIIRILSGSNGNKADIPTVLLKPATARPIIENNELNMQPAIPPIVISGLENTSVNRNFGGVGGEPNANINHSKSLYSNGRASDWRYTDVGGAMPPRTKMSTESHGGENSGGVGISSTPAASGAIGDSAAVLATSSSSTQSRSTISTVINNNYGNSLPTVSISSSSPPSSSSSVVSTSVPPTTSSTGAAAAAAAAAQATWTIAWNIHIYLTVILYTILAVYSLYKMLTYNKLTHLFSQSYFVCIHLILIIICIARIFYLCYDAYNIHTSFHLFISEMLLNLPATFLTISFSVLILYLFRKALNHKNNRYSALIRPLTVIVGCGVHVMLCVTLHYVESYTLLQHQQHQQYLNYQQQQQQQHYHQLHHSLHRPQQQYATETSSFTSEHAAVWGGGPLITVAGGSIPAAVVAGIASQPSPPRVLSLICQIIYIFICLSLGLLYLYLYHILKRILRSKSQNYIHGYQNVSYAIHITIATALLFVLLAALQIFGAISISSTATILSVARPHISGNNNTSSSTTTDSDWLQWGYQFSLRLIEIAIITLISVVTGLKTTISSNSTGVNDGGGGSTGGAGGSVGLVSGQGIAHAGDDLRYDGVSNDNTSFFGDAGDRAVGEKYDVAIHLQQQHQQLHHYPATASSTQHSTSHHQIHNHQQQQHSSTSSSTTTTNMMAGFFLPCTNTSSSSQEQFDTDFPAVCNTNTNLQTYTMRTGKFIYDDSYALNSLSVDTAGEYQQQHRELRDQPTYQRPYDTASLRSSMTTSNIPHYQHQQNNHHGVDSNTVDDGDGDGTVNYSKHHYNCHHKHSSYTDSLIDGGGAGQHYENPNFELAAGGFNNGDSSIAATSSGSKNNSKFRAKTSITTTLTTSRGLDIVDGENICGDIGNSSSPATIDHCYSEPIQLLVDRMASLPSCSSIFMPQQQQSHIRDTLPSTLGPPQLPSTTTTTGTTTTTLPQKLPLSRNKRHKPSIADACVNPERYSFKWTYSSTSGGVGCSGEPYRSSDYSTLERGSFASIVRKSRTLSNITANSGGSISSAVYHNKYPSHSCGMTIRYIGNSCGDSISLNQQHHHQHKHNNISNNNKLLKLPRQREHIFLQQHDDADESDDWVAADDDDLHSYDNVSDANNDRDDDDVDEADIMLTTVIAVATAAHSEVGGACNNSNGTAAVERINLINNMNDDAGQDENHYAVENKTIPAVPAPLNGSNGINNKKMRSSATKFGSNNGRSSTTIAPNLHSHTTNLKQHQNYGVGAKNGSLLSCKSSSTTSTFTTITNTSSFGGSCAGGKSCNNNKNSNCSSSSNTMLVPEQGFVRFRALQAVGIHNASGGRNHHNIYKQQMALQPIIQQPQQIRTAGGIGLS